MPKMPKNAQKCRKMSKNARKCPKMPENAQKCQKCQNQNVLNASCLAPREYVSADRGADTISRGAKHSDKYPVRKILYGNRQHVPFIYIVILWLRLNSSFIDSPRLKARLKVKILTVGNKTLFNSEMHQISKFKTFQKKI
jgi:hypothetical protein